jgi:prefoldin subunit 5
MNNAYHLSAKKFVGRSNNKPHANELKASLKNKLCEYKLGRQSATKTECKRLSEIINNQNRDIKKLQSTINEQNDILIDSREIICSQEFTIVNLRSELESLHAKLQEQEQITRALQEKMEKQHECLVCMDVIKKENRCVLIPCGHSGFCRKCVSATKTCPHCRNQYMAIMNLYE